MNGVVDLTHGNPSCRPTPPACRGITFTNMFVHTPICNPSRSETLTGRMFHNLKQTGQYGKSIWAMHVNEDKVFNYSFVRSLKEDAGYATGHFGKYLNIMPDYAPTGYDAWLANPGGDYIAPEFDTYGIEDLGFPDGEFDGNSSDYSTAVIGNVSVAWIRKTVTENPDTPFFAYVAPKAAHEPFLPAPWYALAAHVITQTDHLRTARTYEPHLNARLQVRRRVGRVVARDRTSRHAGLQCIVRGPSGSSRKHCHQPHAL